MATFIKMVLTRADGSEGEVWQKSEVIEQVVAVVSDVTYVDASGNPIEIAEPYEMRVADPTEHEVPGK